MRMMLNATHTTLIHEVKYLQEQLLALLFIEVTSAGLLLLLLIFDGYGLNRMEVITKLLKLCITTVRTVSTPLLLQLAVVMYVLTPAILF